MRNGIPCPFCGTYSHSVVNSRPDKDSIMRRRECKNGHRWTTYEAVMGGIDKAASLTSRFYKLGRREQRVVRNVLAALEAE